MPLSLSIALRFLFRSVRSRPLKLFALVSIFGIAFSLMLFLLIDALINGLSQNMKQSLLSFEAPLSLSVSATEVDTTFLALEKFKKVHPEFGIQFFSVSQFDGLVQVPSEASSGASVRAVDADFFNIKRDEIEILWFEGYSEEVFSQSTNQILVGESLYERLRFMQDSEEILVLTHPFADIGPTGDVEPSDRPFEVAGVFHTGRDDFDDVFVLIPKAAFTEMSNPLMQSAEFFLVPKRLSDVEKIQTLWQKDNSKLPGLLSWTEKNKALLKAMRLEKILYLFILTLMMLISCFNLAGVVAIFCTSKAEETALLRTLGMTFAQIRMVFVEVGIMLGALGGFIGVSLALLLITVAKNLHLSLPKAYGFSELPFMVHPSTVLLLVFVTPVLAAVIALFPVSRLTKHTVTSVLRLS